MSKCQSKTLTEQFNAGARSFDLRFAKHRGKWYAAHGVQIYNRTLRHELHLKYVSDIGIGDAHVPRSFYLLINKCFSK